jgi:hypothetical protein
MIQIHQLKPITKEKMKKELEGEEREGSILEEELRDKRQELEEN